MGLTHRLLELPRAAVDTTVGGARHAGRAAAGTAAGTARFGVTAGVAGTRIAVRTVAGGARVGATGARLAVHTGVGATRVATEMAADAARIATGRQRASEPGTLAGIPVLGGFDTFVRAVRPVVDLPHRHRRVWWCEDRAHIELRELDVASQGRFLDELSTALHGVPGVSAVTVQPAMGRVVVTGVDPGRRDELVAVVHRVEAICGVDDAPLGVHRPDHPADLEPIVRSVIMVGVDVAGLGLAVAGRILRLPQLAIEIDTAAALAVADNIPAVRDRLDRRLSHPVAELALAVSGGLASGLAQGLLGPVTDIVLRSVLLDEAMARRGAFVSREPGRFCLVDGDGTLAPPQRSAPLRDGALETYTERAWGASLGASAAGLVFTRSIDRALGLLVAGLPKAARLGMEAYAAGIGRVLAGRGIVVRDPDVLRHLDRLDVLFVEADVLVHRRLGHRGTVELESQAPDLLASARRQELRVVVVTDDGSPIDVLDADETVPLAAATEQIRRTQADGSGVLVVGTDRMAGLDHADVSVGLDRSGRPSTRASIIAGDDLADAYLVLEAAAMARSVASESVGLAVAGASTSVLLSLGGHSPGATRRVLSTLNAASLVAIANGLRNAHAVGRVPLPPRRDQTPWHSLDVDEVFALLRSGPEGLSTDEALSRHDPPGEPTPPIVELARAIAGELANPLTPVLVAATGLSIATGSLSDAALISSVVGLNAAIGGLQAFRAERTVRDLVHRESHRFRTLRDGSTTVVDEDELVRGDVIELESGDTVPADCRILRCRALEVDESSLTGESLPVRKSAGVVDRPDPVADRTSMLYEGTSIAAGHATAVIAETGEATEARRGVLLARAGAPESGVEVRLEQLTSTLLPFSILSGLAVIGAGVVRRIPLAEIVGSGVSLAVAAVPEGLPLLATVAQQGAARRLSEKGVVVSNARAIEALGRVDVLCADKTGTLTDGRIRVHVVADADREASLDEVDGNLREVLAAAMRASPPNHAGEKSPHPTDRALHHAAEDGDVAETHGVSGWQRIAEIPFEPGRGFHATLGDDDGDGRLLSVKGAPEVVLPRCSSARRDGAVVELDDDTRARLEDRTAELARRGVRVLTVAERRLGAGNGERAGDIDPDRDVADLTFVGLVGLRDGIRPTSAEAVASLRAAGIDVIMITGDHPMTAAGIAEDLGLLAGDGLVTGAEIDALGDNELADKLRTASVCARVTPLHKARIVRALQDAGRVVAMTGDGANDAAAIRLADVGIALGTRATPAARDAGDLVVTDDRIETIVAACAEGRGLWVSTRDAVAVLVGGNLGEMAVTVGGALLTGRSPLNARQLLLTNLLTDVAPALTIAARPPRDVAAAALLAEGPDTTLGAGLDAAIRRRALVTASAAGGAWLVGRLTGTPQRASTIALVSLVGTQLAQTIRDGRGDRAVTVAGVASGVLLAGIVQTPGVSSVFGCRPLGPVGWATALGSTAVAMGLLGEGPRGAGDTHDTTEPAGETTGVDHGRR